MIDPGDRSRYVFRSGTSAMGGPTEWFEITEVLKGVEAKDIQASLRVENGGNVGSQFDRKGLRSG